MIEKRTDRWAPLLALLLIAGGVPPAHGASMVRVQCDQEGAEVYVDGQFKGECPLDLSVAAGSHRIELKKAGDPDWYWHYEQEVRLGDEVVKRLEAKLEKTLTEQGKEKEAARVKAEQEAAEKKRAAMSAEVRAMVEKMRVVKIPAGSFPMGSPPGEKDRSDDERQHRVTIAKPFEMAAHETTFAEYDLFAKATGRPRPKDEGWGRGNRPVIHVSWDDATAYAQ